MKDLVLDFYFSGIFLSVLYFIYKLISDKDFGHTFFSKKGMFFLTLGALFSWIFLFAIMLGSLISKHNIDRDNF